MEIFTGNAKIEWNKWEKFKFLLSLFRSSICSFTNVSVSDSYKTKTFVANVRWKNLNTLKLKTLRGLLEIFKA